MANVSQLNAAIADLTAQVAATEGTEDSAVALITGFSAAISDAVTAALTADNAADDASITAAQAAITATTARFTASAQKLGAAVAANPGPVVPPVVP